MTYQEKLTDNQKAALREYVALTKEADVLIFTELQVRPSEMTMRMAADWVRTVLKKGRPKVEARWGTAE